MGRTVGIEPTHVGTTIQCVNHFTKSASTFVILSQIYSFVNYFIENFRSDEDLKSFLDYYFSIIYAYLKTNNCSGEFNEIESKFIRCYEDNDKSLYEFYCSNFDIRYYLIVCLYNIYIKHDVQFDMRDNIKDSKSIDLFKKDKLISILTKLEYCGIILDE